MTWPGCYPDPGDSPTDERSVDGRTAQRLRTPGASTTPDDSRDGFCPVTVTTDLDHLRGPVHGRHRLPHDLDPHGSTHYDLADQWARRRLTITVLTTAALCDELHTWIDRDTLLTAWPTLYLDTHTRTAWQRRHPRLNTRPARWVPEN